MVWTHRTASVFAIINFKREREGAGLSKVLRVHSLIFRSGVQVIWVVRWLICNQREYNISCCVILISYRDPPRPGSCSQALVTTTCSPGGSRRPSCWLHRAFLCLDRLCPWAKEAEASEDERRIQPVSSFQTNLPQRSRGQVCSSACWKLRRLNCFFCVLAMSEEARSVSTPI